MMDYVAVYTVFGETPRLAQSDDETARTTAPRFGIAEPDPVTKSHAVTFTAGKPHLNDLTAAHVSADGLEMFAERLPEEPTSVYADGELISTPPDKAYPSRFNGPFPVTFSPFKTNGCETEALTVDFGQPGENGPEYILTPTQTEQLSRLFARLYAEHHRGNRISNGINAPVTVDSSGKINTNSPVFEH